MPVGGAADPWSARLANRLVGNREDAALLEITLGDALLATDHGAWMALTGGLRAATGGVELPLNEAWQLRPGGSVRIRAADGARGYLAVAGGLVVESVLGSASTDLRTGFGGLEGRALRAGDRLEIGPMTGPPARWTGDAATGPIRIVAGPHPETIGALDGGLDRGGRGGSHRRAARRPAPSRAARCRRWDCRSARSRSRRTAGRSSCSPTAR